MSEDEDGGATERLPIVGKAPAGKASPGEAPPGEAPPGKVPAELDQSASAASYTPVLDDGDDGDASPRGRLWSTRRAPAAVVALLVLGAAGLLLYDLAAVRADRPAMRWRRALATELAERPLDDLWVLVGAGLAAAIGVWLLVLVATPGQRSVLAMRADAPDVRAWLDRDAAALVLRDRAMEVSGVRSVRVRVTRSRVEARAVAHYRELDDVRTDLDTTLSEGMRGLGLVHAPALSVRVARPGKRG
ncbi:DUF6286 domain-containing protein [Streptomyces apocyni]|uniref:DUF6286 domain-containing protein n=1 Tax=Streptomyces apocyni TaxID=2654677 RepID=UPI0012EAD957|nr:DUF6286 domain-containing protein [Streptomyces apocyni]